MPKNRVVLAALALFALLSPGLRAATVPRPAPDFKINLTNGHQVSISQFKGHTVALIFILTYCPHCQKTVALLSLAGLALVVAGCNTVEGVGKDVKATGNAIEKAADKAKPK